MLRITNTVVNISILHLEKNDVRIDNPENLLQGARLMSSQFIPSEQKKMMWNKYG